MVILFQADDAPSGTVSQISWSNPDLHIALRLAFKENSSVEEIVRIDVTKEGLIAYFVRKKAK